MRWLQRIEIRAHVYVPTLLTRSIHVDSELNDPCPWTLYQSKIFFACGAPTVKFATRSIYLCSSKMFFACGAPADK